MKVLRGDLRGAPRFVPMTSVAAAVFDGDFIVRGVVANLSESGVSVVSDRDVRRGSRVTLKLSRKESGFLETEARVVWHTPGAAPVQKWVGIRQGFSFIQPSSVEPEKIRTLILSPDFNLNGVEKNLLQAVDFTYLIDPDIETLFSEEKLNTEMEIRRIRSLLEPYLRPLVRWRQD